jgi:hypothetical protein
MTADTAQAALALPGLDAPEQRGGVGDLEKAVRRTLAVLEAEGHLSERDAGKLQLAIEMAQVVASKNRTGRNSTIGNDARVLMEILDSFVTEAAASDEGDFASVLAQWEALVRAERQEEATHARHASAEVRDRP